jgi:hypothetical protein
VLGISHKKTPAKTLRVRAFLTGNTRFLRVIATNSLATFRASRGLRLIGDSWNDLMLSLRGGISGSDRRA